MGWGILLENLRGLIVSGRRIFQKQLPGSDRRCGEACLVAKGHEKKRLAEYLFRCLTLSELIQPQRACP